MSRSVRTVALAAAASVLPLVYGGMYAGDAVIHLAYAERAAAESLALPVFGELADEQLRYVVESLQAVVSDQGSAIGGRGEPRSADPPRALPCLRSSGAAVPSRDRRASHLLDPAKLTNLDKSKYQAKP